MVMLRISLDPVTLTTLITKNMELEITEAAEDLRQGRRQ